MADDNIQILVLGAGYAGMMAALRLSGKTKKQGANITLVNGADAFVQRPRLHQAATGQAVPQKPEAAIINVSSGLAYVPMAGAPVYCATKAALHSWTRSLWHQLAQTPVKVFEVLPPTVDTEMAGELEATKISPQVMAAETIKNLRKDDYEIRVGQTRALYVMSRLVPTLAESLLKKA